MTDTSMIVTLYQGDRYLPYLLQIAEENFRNMKLRLGLDCELILVNDDPRKILPIKGGGEGLGGNYCTQLGREPGHTWRKAIRSEAGKRPVSCLLGSG